MNHPAPWLLLIHAIPPKPDYFRVKVRRRLQKLGAAAIKNSVYVLPNSEDALEDFQWLAQEIRAEGGEAIVTEASFVSGVSDAEVRAMLEQPQAVAETAMQGRTWVTRVGVKVDRIASAWLIRRFIDRAARFRFVPAKGYVPAEGELRFDMFEAEYTHEGELCTFEVLLRRFGLLGDARLEAIGQIVHDLDLKDDKYRRPETEGVRQMIEGLVAAETDDAARVEKGGMLLDSLYSVHG